MKRTDTQPSGPEHRASDEQPVPRVVSYGVVLAAQGRIDYRTFLFANVGADSEHPAATAPSRRSTAAWTCDEGHCWT